MSEYAETERKLASHEAVETIETERNEGGEYRLWVQTVSATIPPAVMRILADADLSIKPVGEGRLKAQPEADHTGGVRFAFPPEIWGTILGQYRYLDALLDAPRELAIAAEALVEEDMAEDVSDAIDELELTRDFYGIFEDKMEEGMKETLIEEYGDADWDAEEMKERGTVERVPEVDSGVMISGEPAWGDDRESTVELPSAGSKQRLVLETLAEEGPLTAARAVEESGYKHAQAVLSTLKSDGLVEVVDTHERRDGNDSYVYDVTDEVREALGVAA